MGVKVSKLEPHVLGGPPQDEIDQVLQAMDEESDTVHPTVATSEEPVEDAVTQDKSFKDSFVRFVDFLKNKKQEPLGGRRSKKAIALRAYQRQSDLFAKRDDELADEAFRIHRFA